MARREPLVPVAVTAVGGTMVGLASEVRLKRWRQPLTDRWRRTPVVPPGATKLGISFRPRQAEVFGLDAQSALEALLAYPIDIVRLGAYWDRMEPAPGRFDPSELDWQVEAAEAAGKRLVICLGPVKCFGYPEYFAPRHIQAGLPEHTVITPTTHPALLRAAIAYIYRVVGRYRHRPAIFAWQVEHEAVEPLGLEHSWRLHPDFVRAEVDAVRSADPARPVMLNGFLPTSTPVRLSQWWRTRPQGDSLTAARSLADVLGVDFYPRHAVLRWGGWSAYLDGSGLPWQQRRWRQLGAWQEAGPDRSLVVAEGQAEPWEAVTVPPDPDGMAAYSCRPEDVIANYNRALRYSRRAGADCAAYLFWGAEYWLLRRQGGDTRYMDAFTRVLAARRGYPLRVL
jgi:hypothetical protein